MQSSTGHDIYPIGEEIKRNRVWYNTITIQSTQKSRCRLEVQSEMKEAAGKRRIVKQASTNYGIEETKR